MTRIIVLDIDGVLIEPLGYLKALQDTVLHFSRAMGVGDWPPTIEGIRAFEAAGLSSEWDMGAACVTLLLTERLLAQPEPELPSEWPQALAFLGSRSCLLSNPEYAGLALDAGKEMASQQAPAQAVRAVLSARLRRDALGNTALAVLDEVLLTRLHSFFDAPVTRVFQHMALGSENISETYGVAPSLESQSYLELYDRPLLSPRMCAELKAASDAGCRSVLCTLRPSLAPDGEAARGHGLSPEAEMARDVLGLNGVPLIGRGHVRWLARRVGEPLVRLVKPFPVQALAAIAAAASGSEADALLAAHQLYRGGELRGPLAELEESEIHVFEDTRNGLAAFERAYQVLRSAGGRVQLHSWGISGGIAAKGEALRAAGATVFQNVNQALCHVLAEPECAEKKREGG